ncbi:MAG: ATP-binding protein [Defluviitaleaceae bacterium]|nr:ATP-binding protein [Defluviitaleaceae bacterium]MCL2239230.1 ATP-binding protein [Defluviitaleaceae bacterium]
MEQAILHKFKLHTTIILIVLMLTVIAVIGIGLLIVVNNTVAIIHDLGDTLADESGYQLTTQTQYNLSLLAQSKAYLLEEKLSNIMDHASIAALTATQIFSNPDYYLPREIAFPDPANEGVIASQLRISQTARLEDLTDEISLMANIEDILIAIYTHSPSPRMVHLSTETGINISVDRDSHLKTRYFESRTRPWYVVAVERDELVWSPIFTDLTRNLPSIICAKPFHDAYGNIAGVVGISIMIETLGVSLIETRIGETGYVFLVNEHTDVLISGRARRDVHGNIMRENLLEDRLFPSVVVANIMRRASGVEQVEINGVETIVIHEPLHSLPWSIVIAMDVSEVIAPAQQIESDIHDLVASAGTAATGSVITLAISAGVLLFISGVVIVLVAMTLFNEMVLNMQNITEEKNRANEASRLKSSFLANMSHEIRTPMNAIMGITEILRRNEAMPADAVSELERMFISCDVLLRIINDILDLSKIEEGKIEISPEIYNTASLINDTAQLNTMYVENKNINFVLTISEGVPATLLGDELRIKQILNNLLSNAFKYTDAGRVILAISNERNPETKDSTLIFTVTDTGRGMNKNQIGMLFGEYVRFDTTASIQGTGLGLAITRRLIHLMNGTIEVESLPGLGTSFTVRLPQGFAHHAILSAETINKLQDFKYSDIKQREIRKHPRNVMPEGRVLIVDDSEMNLHVTSMLMKPYEMKIDMVNSGSLAIDKVAKGNEYDIIFMDQMMPEMDGTEAAGHIRNLGYTGRMVAFTANALVGQEEILRAEGFDDFLAKPIDLRKLDIILNRYIKEREAGKELPGVNITTGLALYANSMEMLIYAFQSYVENVPAVIEKLHDLSEETLPAYATQIHAIKGNSSCIGAEELSLRAQAIEDMAKSGDYEGVAKENASFIDDAQILLDNINTWLEQRNQQ